MGLGCGLRDTFLKARRFPFSWSLLRTSRFSQLERKHPKGSWKGGVLRVGRRIPRSGLRCALLQGEEQTAVVCGPGCGRVLCPPPRRPRGMQSCLSPLTAPRLGKLFIELEGRWMAASGTN